MSKFLKYVLVFIGCIYFVSRMPVFADCFGEEKYDDWVEYYYSQQEDSDQVNNEDNNKVVVKDII